MISAVLFVRLALPAAAAGITPASLDFDVRAEQIAARCAGAVRAADDALKALASLHPLFALRYSATHRNAYNLVYRLDPVRAFEMKLVKQIVVASAVAENSANDAFVRVEAVDYKKGIKAKLRIQVQGNVFKLAKGVVAESYSGYDKIVLQDVFNDLQMVFGRQ